jgi:uncharacterized membrane protein YccC
MTRKDFLATASGVAVTLAAAQAAFAQSAPTRGELGSARNIRFVRQRLEALIDQLQRDRRDFGGYRVRAIEAMEQARANLDQALQWDATHPH